MMKSLFGRRTNKLERRKEGVKNKDRGVAAEDRPDIIEDGEERRKALKYREDLESDIKILDNLVEIKKTCTAGAMPSILDELRKPIELQFELNKNLANDYRPSEMRANNHPGNGLHPQTNQKTQTFAASELDSSSEGHDLAEDIIALKEILSLKETEHNLTLPDAFADVSKETLKKGNYANPDSPVVNERVERIRKGELCKQGGSSSLYNVQLRNTEDTLIRSNVIKPQRSMPHLNHDSNTPEGKRAEIRITNGIKDGNNSGKVAAIDSQQAFDKDVLKAGEILQDALNRQIKRAKKCEMSYIRDEGYSNYVRSLRCKSESDSWFVKILSSVPQTAALVPEIKLIYFNVELFEAVQRAVPQDVITVKIINTTFDGEPPQKSEYTCVTFDLRWSRTFFTDPSESIIETRIAKGTSSFDYNSKKTVKFRFTEAIIRQLECIESRVDLFSVEKTLFSTKKGLIATALVSLRPLLMSRGFSRRVNLLSPITKKKTKWSLNLCIEAERPFLEVKVKKKTNKWAQVDPTTTNPTFCTIDPVVKVREPPDLDNSVLGMEPAPQDVEDKNVIVEDTFYEVLDHEINSFQEKLGKIGSLDAKESKILSERIKSYKRRAIELSSNNIKGLRPKERMSQLEESLRSTREIVSKFREAKNDTMYRAGLERLLCLREEVSEISDSLM